MLAALLITEVELARVASDIVSVVVVVIIRLIDDTGDHGSSKSPISSLNVGLINYKLIARVLSLCLLRAREQFASVRNCDSARELIANPRFSLSLFFLTREEKCFFF